MILRMLLLRQDAHDEDAVAGLLEKHGMAVMLEPEVARAHVSDISAKIRKFTERLERLMEVDNVAFGAG
jgi:hypothetical protein